MFEWICISKQISWMNEWIHILNKSVKLMIQWLTRTVTWHHRNNSIMLYPLIVQQIVWNVQTQTSGVIQTVKSASAVGLCWIINSNVNCQLYLLHKGKFFAIPFADDIAQLGTILELSHPCNSSVFAWCNGLSTEINNLKTYQSKSPTYFATFIYLFWKWMDIPLGR